MDVHRSRVIAESNMGLHAELVMARTFLLALGLMLFAVAANAQCIQLTAGAGWPFNCDATTTPLTTDVLGGGQTSSGKAKSWTIAQVGAAIGSGGGSGLTLSGNATVWTLSPSVSGTGTVATAGTGAVPGDTIPLATAAGTHSAVSVFTISDTDAVAGSVNAGGSGGTTGACTVTGTTGIGTFAQFTGTSLGAL